MAQYSGNLIGQSGDGGTAATGVAANYRRSITPFSNFGTRQIAFLAIENLTATSNGVLTSDTTNVGGTGEEFGIKDSSADVVVPSSYVYPSNHPIYAALNGVAIAAETCFVGAPSFNTGKAKIVVGVYIDTAASANADMQHAALANGNAQSIQDAVRSATGDSGVTVKAVYPAGITFTPVAAY